MLWTIEIALLVLRALLARLAAADLAGVSDRPCTFPPVWLPLRLRCAGRTRSSTCPPPVVKIGTPIFCLIFAALPRCARQLGFIQKGEEEQLRTVGASPDRP